MCGTQGTETHLEGINLVWAVLGWYRDVCKHRSWKCYKIKQLLEAASLEAVIIFLATHFVSKGKK